MSNAPPCSPTMRWTRRCALIKPGADEADILAAMQGAIFSGGGDYPANEFIVGSGAEALLCRYKAGRRKLDVNDQLTLEMGRRLCPLPRRHDAHRRRRHPPVIATANSTTPASKPSRRSKPC